MAQTFIERYNLETTWHAKVLVMEIYHLAMKHHFRGWTLGGTAEYFSVSIGLVSENLRLAQAIHDNEKLMKVSTRQRALKIVNGGRL